MVIMFVIWMMNVSQTILTNLEDARQEIMIVVIQVLMIVKSVGLDIYSYVTKRIIIKININYKIGYGK